MTTSTVAIENAKHGSTDWLPKRLRFSPSGVRGQFVGGQVHPPPVEVLVDIA